MSCQSSASSFIMLIIPGLAAIGACAAAAFTYFAARQTAKANRGQTILACLDIYVSIMKDKRNSIIKCDAGQAREFYRELFDLHWSEFHLWHEGAIPDHVMKAWLNVRKRNFETDEIIIKSETSAEFRISYADAWHDVKDSKYFEPDDPFIAFMEAAHSTKMDKIRLRALKDDTKRRMR